MTILPKGVYTALITPFTADGELDLPGLHQLIEEQIDAHISGLVLLGTTGEVPTLTQDEESTLISFANEVINKRVPLIVGVGTACTASSLKKLKIASKLGADGVMVVCPYYNRPSQEGLFYHFKTLADASDIPLILYNHPSRTGVNLELETLRRLLPHDNIIGIKEASGNLTYFMDLIRSFSKELLIISGDDPFAYPHFALGAHGLLSVASHLIPHAMVKLASLVFERRFDEAISLHYTLLPLLQTLFIETNPAPIKRGLELLGKPGGAPRLPLAPLSPHHTKALEKLLCFVHLTSPV